MAADSRDEGVGKTKNGRSCAFSTDDRLRGWWQTEDGWSGALSLQITLIALRWCHRNNTHLESNRVIFPNSHCLILGERERRSMYRDLYNCMASEIIRDHQSLVISDGFEFAICLFQQRPLMNKDLWSYLPARWNGTEAGIWWERKPLCWCHLPPHWAKKTDDETWVKPWPSSN